NVYYCKNNKELIDTLRNLFYPIAPTINICSTSDKFFIKKHQNKRSAELIYWQHLGLKTSDSSSYNNKRVNAYAYSNKIFEYSPKTGESIRKEIVPGIYCYIPVTLNKDYKPNKSDTKRLKDELHLINDTLSVDNKFVRLANIVITWNYVQHFYPYFDVVKTDWERVLPKTLTNAIKDKNRKEFLNSLRQMMAYLDDGHAITKDLLAEYGRLPIKIDLVEEKVIVVYSADTNEFKLGDVIIGFDEKNIRDELLQAESLISGSKQWKQTIALERICAGPKGSSVKIKIVRCNDTLSFHSLRNSNMYLDEDRPKFLKLDHNKVYVNLNTISMDEIYGHIEMISKADGVIFDLRTYPKKNHEILSYLINGKKISQDWMRIPQIIYPDHRKMKYKEIGWDLQPKDPQIKGDVVFITSSRAISYAESVLGFVEGYKLGEIVGQPTAGANGNIVIFILLDEFEVWFTGMKVVKHDGSQHHTIGIEPTVYVEKTIEGVKSGRDEFLEKAIEVLDKKLN
ncbi:MAG TPA: S41 family peptidase, partial [Bacteroidales bacterium]|nr:S41 family peptidase [Bacteroidales bacterium]